VKLLAERFSTLNLVSPCGLISFTSRRFRHFITPNAVVLPCTVSTNHTAPFDPSIDDAELGVNNMHVGCIISCFGADTQGRKLCNAMQRGQNVGGIRNNAP
jgi:hypothetical protein